jgi:type IV pilus assembly protein PilA
MAPRRTHRAGFTLIELMIAVAIVGILAALAIPNFLRFQLRAKSSEAKANLAAIRTSEDAYFSEFGVFIAAAATPAALPGGVRQPWPSPTPGCPNCFDTLGFVPEGEVLFQYEVVVAIAGATATGADVFTAAAIADLDNDGATQIWGYVRPLPDQTGGQASVLVGGQPQAPCSAAGIWDPLAASSLRLNTVGPCDPMSGQAVF